MVELVFSEQLQISVEYCFSEGS